MDERLNVKVWAVPCSPKSERLGESFDTDWWLANMSSLRDNLQKAVRDYDFEVMEKLLADCHTTNSVGEAQACLSRVLDTGSVKMLKLFLKCGCDPNGPIITIDKWNPSTPLVYALHTRSYKCAECLIKAGADPNMYLGITDLSPLLVTVDANLPEYTKLILRHGGEDLTLYEYIVHIHKLYFNAVRAQNRCFAPIKTDMVRQNTIHNDPSHTFPRGWTPETHSLYTFTRFYPPPKPLSVSSDLVRTFWTPNQTTIHVSISDCAESLLMIVALLEVSYPQSTIHNSFPLLDEPSSRETSIACEETPLEVYYDLMRELGWMSD